MLCRRLAAFGLSLLAAACSIPQSGDSEDSARIYVIERGWHTDIGLPVDEITGPLSALVNEFPGVRVLTFGFGERQFLIGRKTNFGAMLNALLPSESASLVTALRTTPQAAFGPSNVVVLSLPRSGLERIETSIWQELERSGDEPIMLADGPYPGSVFYAARDTYYGLFTCNTWTAETLRAGGFALPSTGVLFSGQVMGMVRWIAARQAR